jgi:transposase-like protein
MSSSKHRLSIPQHVDTRPSSRSGRSAWFERAIAEGGERFGVVTRVARQLGVGAETLRLWVNQAEVDAGQCPGPPTSRGTDS